MILSNFVKSPESTLGPREISGSQSLGLARNGPQACCIALASWFAPATAVQQGLPSGSHCLAPHECVKGMSFSRFFNVLNAGGSHEGSPSHHRFQYSLRSSNESNDLDDLGVLAS